ncbi:unnamed protein product [Citrullus colocynthis]|uniref:Uncharacterized protein n=1 Tax=Citrullus colocynthis TaxID=252529 RepID=A0ABP0YT07_9ROSI
MKFWRCRSDPQERNQREGKQKNTTWDFRKGHHTSSSRYVDMNWVSEIRSQSLPLKCDPATLDTDSSWAPSTRVNTQNDNISFVGYDVAGWQRTCGKSFARVKSPDFFSL